MSESQLRRSSRRRDKKPDSKFSVGMVVEITRDRIRSKGRLISRLTNDEHSTNPRWVVSFVDKSWPEEDMYESSFGPILEHVSDKKEEPPRSNNSSKASKKSNNNAKNTASPSVSRTGSPTPSSQANQPRPKKKTATTPPPTPTEPELMESPSNSSNNLPEDAASVASSVNNNKKRKWETESDDSAARKKADDREARRKRREAVVEEEEEVKAHGPTPSSLAKKKNKGEEVIRVPLLTGTLFLYRGPHRRAEFHYKK